MKWWLLIGLVLGGGGCATTAPGFGPSVATPGAPAEAVPADVTVEAADAPLDQPNIVITATSPTDIQFRADPRDVVVQAMPRRANLRRREVVYQSMLIGTTIGVVAGLVGGAARERQQSTSPEEHDTLGSGFGPILGSVAAGAVGLGLGAAVGAIVGRLGYP